ncbi:hypothetical protein [Pengzhenrongella phosphoraccumulans]|uniref:hypothetical protein n=1 Tax=Pengzhenrongella phosphoraccumulans TaxID=3114394 RepID=UPI00388FF5DD
MTDHGSIRETASRTRRGAPSRAADGVGIPELAVVRTEGVGDDAADVRGEPAAAWVSVAAMVGSAFGESDGEPSVSVLGLVMRVNSAPTAAVAPATAVEARRKAFDKASVTTEATGTADASPSTGRGAAGAVGAARCARAGGTTGPGDGATVGLPESRFGSACVPGAGFEGDAFGGVGVEDAGLGATGRGSAGRGSKTAADSTTGTDAGVDVEGSCRDGSNWDGSCCDGVTTRGGAVEGRGPDRPGPLRGGIEGGIGRSLLIPLPRS